MPVTAFIAVIFITLAVISRATNGASLRSTFFSLVALMMATTTVALGLSSNLIAWVSIALGMAAIFVTIASILKGERIKA